METTLTPLQNILCHLWCWDISKNAANTQKDIKYLVVRCCKQTATIFYYYNTTKVHYVVLYPWQQWTSGIFDYMTAESDFETYITETVECEIAILNTPSIPTFKNYNCDRNNNKIQ